MSRVLTVGWTCLLGLMWLYGGAFLPRQLVWISALAALLVGVTAAGLRGPLDPGERLLAAGLGLAALGLLVVHGDPLSGLERLGWWAVGLAALVAGRRGSTLRWGTPPLMAAAVCVALGTMAEGIVLGVPRAGGLFENPNVAAGVLVPALVLVVGAKIPGPVRGAVAAILLAGLVATGSRAGLVAVMAAGAVAVPRRWRRWWPLAAALLVAAGVWRMTAWPDPLAWRRPAIWKASATVALSHPLWGASAGAFDEAVLPFRPEEPTAVARWSKRPGSAESTPLQALAETGLPAAGLLGWGFLVLATAAVRRGAPDAAMVGAVLVFAVFHDVLGVPVLLWSWAWMLGRAAGPPGTAARSGGHPAAVAMAGLAVALLLGRATVAPELALVRLHGDGPVSAAATEPLLALPWLERAHEKLTEPGWSWQDGAEALDAADRVTSLHPADSTGWRLLGECAARTARELAMLPPVSRRARQAFEHATRLDPHSPWGWLGWARLERDLGRLERAQALARRALTEEPHLVRGWLLLARLALDRGEVGTARRALLEAEAALRLERGRLLSRYERDLLEAPRWQLEQLRKAVP